MIVGTGIDLVEIEQMEEGIRRTGQRLIERIFTESEIDYCERQAQPLLHYAARFAAKEGALKALGLGVLSGISLRDIEVVTADGGRPTLRAHGAFAEKLAKAGEGRLHLSLSHAPRYAAAVVIHESG